MEKREKFGSRLGFVLVSAGCAIGLGNVWKFPYMTGRYGGAVFIMIYLLFLVILGAPIMLCEFAVGRSSQQSVATAFRKLEPEGTRWHSFGWVGMIANYLLMMFYTMVGGWMMFYCYKMMTGTFSAPGINSEMIHQEFDQMLQSWQPMALWMMIAIVLAFFICSLGVQKGVEKVTKIMMICLMGLILVLAIRSVTLEGAGAGLRFYLVPNMDTIAEIGIGNIIFGAMSQAFFTLSVGIGSMAIFGSYLDKKRSLTGETINIMILDTIVALVAGLIVIPACFAFGIEPDAGPSLIFITLPNVFTQMPGGWAWGGLFFLFLSFAALSTIVAVFQNILSFAMDLWGWSRRKAVLVNIVAVALLSMPCVLGFNVLSGVQPFGAGSTIMDLEDFLVSSNLLPLGSLVYVMFCTKKNGWGWNHFVGEVNQGSGMRFPEKIRFYMVYVLPVIVVAVYLKGYYDLFSNKGTVTFTIWMIVAFAFLALIFWLGTSKRKRS